MHAEIYIFAEGKELFELERRKLRKSASQQGAWERDDGERGSNASGSLFGWSNGTTVKDELETMLKENRSFRQKEAAVLEELIGSGFLDADLDSDLG